MSVVGRVVILWVVCCASWKAPSCAFMHSPEVVHRSGLLLEWGFSPSVCLTPCSVGGKSSVLQSAPSDLAGGRIAHRRWCVLPKNDRLVTRNTDGTECWLCLWVLHRFGNGCCWSRAVWKDSDSLPYVQCLFLTKSQLWASCPVLGRLNKPGFLCLKVLHKDFGKLAFKSQCFSLLKPSF